MENNKLKNIKKVTRYNIEIIKKEVRKRNPNFKKIDLCCNVLEFNIQTLVDNVNEIQKIKELK